MEKYITKKTDLYCNLLDFLENDDQTDEIFSKLINIYQTQNIGETHSELKKLLFLISKVSKHHHRGPNFNQKINKILLHLVEIDDFAFMSCSSLSNLAIPGSVIRIGKDVFKDCESLKEVTIPNSSNLDEDSFDENIKVKRI